MATGFFGRWHQNTWLVTSPTGSRCPDNPQVNHRPKCAPARAPWKEVAVFQNQFFQRRYALESGLSR